MSGKVPIYGDVVTGSVKKESEFNTGTSSEEPEEKKDEEENLRLILADRLYIPRGIWCMLRGQSKDTIIDLFRKEIFGAHFCDTFSRGLFCSVRKEKGFQACSHCDFAKQVLTCLFKSKKYIMVDRGDLDLVKQVISLIRADLSPKKVRVEDKRVFFELPSSMQFSSLYSDDEEFREREQEQVRVANLWLEKKFGQIMAPPRFGKCKLATMLSSNLNTRVAIFAHQKELLDQFKEDFYRFTDISEKEKLLGKSLVAINPKPELVENYSVCLYTYQQFISSSGKERIQKVRKLFGFTVVDESHRSSADGYSKVISKFWAKYRVGLSATPSRKDQMDFRQNRILGPVNVGGGSEQLSCEYATLFTKWVMPQYKEMNSTTWNLLWNSLAKAEDRNSIIASSIKEDLSKGYNIVVPVRRIKHLTTLLESVKKIGACKDKEIAILSGKVPKDEREKIVGDIKKGKYRLVIAINKLISLGFTAPTLSCIYLNVGGYHFDMNNAYQEYSRVRTFMKGKKTPLIRIVSDLGKISASSTEKLSKEMESRKFTKLQASEAEKKKSRRLM